MIQMRVNRRCWLCSRYCAFFSRVCWCVNVISPMYTCAARYKLSWHHVFAWRGRFVDPGRHAGCNTSHTYHCLLKEVHIAFFGAVRVSLTPTYNGGLACPRAAVGFSFHTILLLSLPWSLFKCPASPKSAIPLQIHGHPFSATPPTQL